MGKIIELTHDDVQNELAYALICETMEGAYWNSGRRRRMFSKAFTRSEQQRISNIKAKAHKWYLVTGVLNIVHNTRDFPLHECLEFNNGSMDWHGSHPALWHYGEGHDINYAKALAKIRKFKDADIGERFNMQLDDAFKQFAKNGHLVD